MRFFLSPIIFLGISVLSFGQHDGTFKIKTVFQEERKPDTAVEALRETGKPFYEDELFLVSKICMGEWGGVIRFKEKKTGIEFESYANCPKSVFKMDGKYVVVNTLLHMSPSTQILEIKDPRKLDRVPATSKIHIIDGRELISSEEMEKKTQNGTKTLIKNRGFLTVGSFPYQGKLYHLISDNRKTYLAEVKNEEFVIIQVLLEKDTWFNRTDLVATKDKHFIMFFNSDGVKGYFDIFEDQITVVRYK